MVRHGEVSGLERGTNRNAKEDLQQKGSCTVGATVHLQKKASMDMELESFCKLYEEDVRPRLKKSTWLTKENIIKSKILPYLGKRKVSKLPQRMFWTGIMNFAN